MRTSRALFALSFAGLFALSLALRPGAQVVAPGGPHGAAPARFPAPEPGTFPAQWIAGTDCANDPEIQVHAYNDDFYILRQSRCEIFEAPFVYLIFGAQRALMLDTGALASIDMQGAVDTIVQSWLVRNNQPALELVVAHTHKHGDHVQGDAQFAGLPNVTVVPLGGSALHDFFGFASWPSDIVQYDLGGRVLDLIATPGHEADHIAFYDRQTQLLITGDIAYPGHIFIFNSSGWPQYQASLRRLALFADQNPVEWVLGCHVEFSDQPFAPYPYGAKVQPNEHALELPASILQQMSDAANALGAQPSCQIFEHWVIHPVYLCGIGWNG